MGCSGVAHVVVATSTGLRQLYQTGAAMAEHAGRGDRAVGPEAGGLPNGGVLSLARETTVVSSLQDWKGSMTSAARRASGQGSANRTGVFGRAASQRKDDVRC
jgi:hypothetical protein